MQFVSTELSSSHHQHHPHHPHPLIHHQPEQLAHQSTAIHPHYQLVDLGGYQYPSQEVPAQVSETSEQTYSSAWIDPQSHHQLQPLDHEPQQQQHNLGHNHHQQPLDHQQAQHEQTYELLHQHQHHHQQQQHHHHHHPQVDQIHQLQHQQYQQQQLYLHQQPLHLQHQQPQLTYHYQLSHSTTEGLLEHNHQLHQLELTQEHQLPLHSTTNNLLELNQQQQHQQQQPPPQITDQHQLSSFPTTDDLLQLNEQQQQHPHQLYSQPVDSEEAPLPVYHHLPSAQEQSLCVFATPPVECNQTEHTQFVEGKLKLPRPLQPTSAHRSTAGESQSSFGGAISCDESPSSPSFSEDSSASALTRDEKRAREANIPMSYYQIVNLSIDQFNEQLAKHNLTESQLNLIKDIRRRGKNKVAAQSCRKRKMEQIYELQLEVNQLAQRKRSLSYERQQLLKERGTLMQRYDIIYKTIQENLQQQQHVLQVQVQQQQQPQQHC